MTSCENKHNPSFTQSDLSKSKFRPAFVASGVTFIISQNNTVFLPFKISHLCVFSSPFKSFFWCLKGKHTHHFYSLFAKELDAMARAPRK